jgi:hypothetical protein
MKRSRFPGLVLLSAGLAACAASPKKSAEPPPSEMEQRDGTKVTDSDREPGGAASAGAATAQPAPLAAARGELERASADLEAGLSECTSACRALASMERAAAHLCELDGAKECSSAKERVERARAKVKSSGCSCSK